MRESRPYGSVRGAESISVPTATVLRCMSSLSALNGHPGPPGGRLLSGAKRKSASASSTSEFDPKRKSSNNSRQLPHIG